MKTILSISLRICICAAMLTSALADPISITVANDIDDSVESIAWHQDMNLLEVAGLRTRGSFTNVIYVLSNGHLQAVKKFGDVNLSATKIPAGSVIILGKLLSRREDKLRANSVIDQAFKALPPMRSFGEW